MRSLLLLLLVGCTSSSSSPAATEDPGPRSMLAPELSLRDMTDAQRTVLCNWWGEALGGDGRMQSCSECTGNGCTDWDVTVSTLDDCLASLRGTECDATVEEAENCAFAQKPDLCASPAACDLLDGC